MTHRQDTSFPARFAECPVKTVSSRTKYKQITDTVTTVVHVRANVFRLDNKNSRPSSIAATNLTLRYCGRVEEEADNEILLKLCSHPQQGPTCFSAEAVRVLAPPNRREDIACWSVYKIG